MRTLFDTFTEEIIQDVSAIQVTADSLLYGFQRGWPFSNERLRESLELIAAACRQAAKRIEDARRQFPSV